MTAELMEDSLLVDVEEDEVVDDPGRHRNLERICGLLQDILYGRAADELLDRGLGGESRRILILPAWDWRKPAMDIGRKALDRGTGLQLLMPVRLDWGGNSNLVQLVNDRGPLEDQQWQAMSMGWMDAGVVSGPDLYRHQDGPALSGDAVSKRLNALSITGNDAMWQLVLGLEQFVETTVHKAHAAISYDVATLTGRHQNVLHETGVEQIVNRMLLGSAEGDRGETASVMRMLNLCLEPGCFTKVDPMRYMHTHLRRDAEQEVRKAIGDPRIGSKIRRMAVLMPGASLEEVVAAYRIEHPQDRLSIKRAEAALSVNSDPMARSVMLDPETNRSLV